MSRARRTPIPEQSPRLLLLGTAVFALAAAVLLIAMRSSGGLPGETHYDLRVQFGRSSAAPVLPARGSDVRIAGRRVGQTLDAELERGVATLHLQLDRDAGPLRAGTRAEVRAQGLLGARYVDLVPGRTGHHLPDDGIVPPARASIRVSLSDALQAFDARTRPALRQTLRGLGGGLAGRGGQLNEGLDDLALGLDRFRHALRPTLADRTLPGLLRGGQALTGALEPVRHDFALLLGEAEHAARPFAAEAGAVGRLLDTAPRSLEDVRAGLARSAPALHRATRFARAASSFSAAAPDGLRALDRVLRDGRAPLRSADAVLRAAGAAVPPTLRLTNALRPVLPRLRGVLGAARQPARTLGRYGCDVTRFGRTWRSFLGYAARGQSGPLGPLAVLRTTLVASGGPPGAPNMTPGAAVDGTIAPCEPLRGPR